MDGMTGREEAGPDQTLLGYFYALKLASDIYLTAFSGPGADPPSLETCGDQPKLTLPASGGGS